LLTARLPDPQKCIDPAIIWFCLVLLQPEPPTFAEQLPELRGSLLQQVAFAELKPGYGTTLSAMTCQMSRVAQ
jgi:hypothetical protein